MSQPIAFAHTSEQTLFRDSLRRFLEAESPTTRVRQVIIDAPGFDAQVWSRMSAELALPGIAIPEAQGGAGFGWVELCIAAEELGRALCPSPFFASSVLAASALGVVAPDDALLPGIATGESRAALALLEDAGGWDYHHVACAAEAGSAGVRLSGVKSFVVDGATADVLLVVARRPSGTGRDHLGLYALDAQAAGLERHALTVIDPTRPLARIAMHRVPARLVGTMTTEHLERVLDLSAIALANEMVGGMTRLFESTLAYTRMRVQFGRTIASFQAIKHRMAELLLQVELARSAAYYAAAAVDAGESNLSYLASLAKSSVSDAYVLTAQEAIQMHGGIGFTWDHDTHLWFKRAKSSEVFLGTPSWHRDRMIHALTSGETGT